MFQPILTEEVKKNFLNVNADIQHRVRSYWFKSGDLEHNANEQNVSGHLRTKQNCQCKLYFLPIMYFNEN